LPHHRIDQRRAVTSADLQQQLKPVALDLDAAPAATPVPNKNALVPIND
jgi:hypothetical protein